ncbi:MAG: glutathione S-transferase [Pseudomonadota bacterium]
MIAAQMTPILYSFRRCPYAMRLRLALAVSGQSVELREIVLRDKPQAFLDASPSATVPCLVLPDQTLDESLDAMKWVLGHSDPQRWLDMPPAGDDWIARADGPFKDALDRTKYATRYPGIDPQEQRAKASGFLKDLNRQIEAHDNAWIFGAPTLADFAILPFVRQFAFIDKNWFDTQPWPALSNWLEVFLASDLFQSIMSKYPQWREDETGIAFP